MEINLVLKRGDVIEETRQYIDGTVAIAIGMIGTVSPIENKPVTNIYWRIDEGEVDKSTPLQGGVVKTLFSAEKKISLAIEENNDQGMKITRRVIKNYKMPAGMKWSFGGGK